MIFNTNGLLAPQIPHVERLLQSLKTHGVATDMSEVGTGKSYCAAALAREFKNLPLVLICPKIVIPTWGKVLKKFGVKPNISINYEKLCRGNTPYLKYFKKKNYNYKWELTNLKLPKHSFVILDESHVCKGKDSLNAGLLIALKNLLIENQYKVLTLSATQACSVLDMNAYGHLVNLHKLHDFRAFCKEFGAKDAGFGGLSFDHDDQETKNKMAKCHTILFEEKKIAHRLTRVDMKGYFPDNEVVADVFDTSNAKKIQAVYDEMDWELGKLEDSAADYSQHILAIIIKARREVELLKIPTLVEMFQDLRNEGKSTVLFLNFTESILAAGKRLAKIYGRDKVGYIYGGVSNLQKIKAIDDFQENRVKNLIVNLRAGGSSINLHDIHGDNPRASLINPSWSAIHLMQAIGRISRAEAKTPAYQRIVYADGTIENKICQNVQAKINNLSLLNDGELVTSNLCGLFKFAKM